MPQQFAHVGSAVYKMRRWMVDDTVDIFHTRHPNRWQEHHFAPAISVAKLKNPARSICLMTHPNLKETSCDICDQLESYRSIAWGLPKSQKRPISNMKKRWEALPCLCILNLSLFNEVPGGKESANCLPAQGLRPTIRNDDFHQWYL